MKLPLNWTKKTIGELKLEIGDGNYSSLYPKSNEFVDTGVLFFTANSIQANRLTTIGARFISKEKHSTLKKGQLKKGDILLSTRGDIGKTALVPDEFVGQNINAQLVRLNPMGKMDSTYLWQYLSTTWVKSKIESFQTGSALKQLPIGSLKKIEILHPPLEEQKKIAQVLSTWDEAIEAVNELIEKKKKLFRTLLFTKLRAKSEPNYKIRDIGKIKHGKSQKKVENDSGKYPVLATGGVIGYSNDYLTNKPSVLIGRKGTIDKPGYMDEPFWHVDTLFRIETKVELAIPKWLYFYFLTINWQAYNQGAVLPSLTGSTIESIKLFVPDLATQQDHVSILNGFENQIELLVKKKELLLQQKKGLMQQLLTGKTRIS